MSKDIDENLVRKLAQLLDETGLSEIEYGKADWRVRIARQGNTPVASHTVVAPPPPAVEAAPVAAPSEQKGAVPSPMVGVAYLSPEPDAAPYVTVGDTVQQGQVLLLIEAMKVFNPIQAPHGGTIKAILVESGSPVEYGEPLMIIA